MPEDGHAVTATVPSKPNAGHCLVFVYGTLQVGEPWHGALANARRIGRSRTQPEYALYDLGPFPAMLADGDTAVRGEVYEVDAATLRDLDLLEGHPEFFRRAGVALHDGTVAWAWLLVPTRLPAGAARIANGNWRTRATAASPARKEPRKRA